MSEAGEGGNTARGDVLASLTRALAIAGGALLTAVAVIVCVNVGMRWLLHSAVPGDIELVQLGTALGVFAFLPLCQLHRANIMVDTFTTGLPKRVRNGLDALWDLVWAFIALVLAWRLVIGAYDTMRSNTVSMMLGLPTGWAIAFGALAFAFVGVVSIATAWRLLRERG